MTIHMNFVLYKMSIGHMQGLLQEEYRSVHEASKITFGF